METDSEQVPRGKGEKHSGKEGEIDLKPYVYKEWEPPSIFGILTGTKKGHAMACPSGIIERLSGYCRIYPYIRISRQVSDNDTGHGYCFAVNRMSRLSARDHCRDANILFFLVKSPKMGGGDRVPIEE